MSALILTFNGEDDSIIAVASDEDGLDGEDECLQALNNINIHKKLDAIIMQRVRQMPETATSQHPDTEAPVSQSTGGVDSNYSDLATTPRGYSHNFTNTNTAASLRK